MSRFFQHRARTHILVLALYAALSVVATWPLVRYFGSHLPGSYTWAFDEYTFVWNMWWFRYSLLDLGQTPFYSTHTFYPLGVSLVLYTYNLFNVFLSLPLQAFLPLPAISNLTFLLATTLSGYGTFLLLETLLRKAIPPQPGVVAGSQSQGSGVWVARLAAFLAGLIYAFGSYRFVYAAIGHYNLWSTAWIPFFTLYLVKTIRELRLRNAIVAGIFFVLTMLCDMMLGVFVGMLTLILVAFALASRRRRNVAGGAGGLLKRLLIMAVVATVLYLPVLVPILGEMFGGYELAGWGDAEKLSVDLVGLVTPTALHPLGGDWTQTLQQTREGTSRFRDVNTVFLGWAGLALAVVGAVRYRRRLAAWITSFFVFTVFSLGPLLQINGRSVFDLDGLQVNVPLPFIVLHYLPVIKANRVPNRFGVVLMLALAVMAGFGAYFLLKKLASRGGWPMRWGSGLLGLGLAALILFEHWSVPLPLTDARLPPVYERVAAESDDFAILQLPMGWRNSFGVQGAESTQTQFYQVYHRKRLLSGNISRNPPFKFEYFQRVPILDSLITLQTYGEVDDERRATDKASAEEFVRFYDLRYVVVAPGVPGRPPYVDTREAAVAYVEEVLPVELIEESAGWRLYGVEQTTLPTSFGVDVGSNEPRTMMALGEGWSGAEEIQGASANWAIAEEAQVFLPAAGGTDYQLTVRALPFDYPGAEGQTVTLQIDGHRLGQNALSPGWEAYSWRVPSSLLREGLNEIRFGFERLDAPTDVLPGDGRIGSTGVQAPQAIEVNSGGPADFAFITVGTGEDAQDGSVHRPGYNVALIDPETGQLVDKRGFDTTPGGSEAEAAALADFLAQVPKGTLVAVALQGDGTALLTDEALSALRQIGGQVDPRGNAGWSHAIIGVKGAGPGTVAEAAGPDGAWLRVAPDRRTLAVAIDEIVWEQVE